MGDRGLGALVAIAGGVITVAIVAVIFGRQAQTSQVIGASGTAFSSVISAAVAPVSSTGNTFGSGN